MKKERKQKAGSTKSAKTICHNKPRHMVKRGFTSTTERDENVGKPVWVKWIEPRGKQKHYHKGEVESFDAATRMHTIFYEHGERVPTRLAEQEAAGLLSWHAPGSAAKEQPARKAVAEPATGRKRRRQSDASPPAPEPAPKVEPAAAPYGESKSAYELERERNIAQNQAALAALGLDGPSLTRRPPPSPEELAARAERAAQLAAERAARLQEAFENRRASSRIATRPPPAAARSADRSLDRAEAEADRLRRQSRRRPAAAKGRGGKAAPALTAAQLASLSAADEWLCEMEEWLSPKVSDANLRNVMKVVGNLASGAGVVHPLTGARFREGEPVSPSTDFVALRAEANSFLRPEDDAGHGWRLDHPIGKCILFQHHLHASRR